MKLCKYQILSIMLHSVRVTILLLPLNVTAIWITPNRKKNMSIIKLILIGWEDNLHYLTGQKKFMLQNHSKSVDELWNSFKSEIHEIWNKFVPKQLRGIPSWKIKGIVPIIKSFVMLYGTRVSYTGNGYYQKMF